MCETYGELWSHPTATLEKTNPGGKSNSFYSGHDLDQ